MLKELFEKYAEWKILHYFLVNPQEELHLKELARRLDISAGTASVTLNRAHKAKLLNKKIIGNIHLYSLNNNNQQVRKLKQVVKTV